MHKKRGGWPFPNPINTQFTINKLSPQSQGLMAWWPFSASRGSSTIREMVSGQHGAMSGATWVTDGRMGSGLEFDGGSDYVNTGGALDPPALMTIVMWVYWLGETSPASHQGLIAKRNAWGVAAMRWQFNHNSGGILQLISDGDAGGNFGVDLTANTLQCVALTNGVSAANLYLDGVYAATHDECTFSGDASANLVIGASQISSDQEAFNGKIFDVRIYERVLSASEILHQYNNPWELYRPSVPYTIAKELAAPEPPAAASNLMLMGVG